MKEIVVPGPPRTAFNKHRRMSDLIQKQVEHFKHLEHKLSPEVRATLPQHDVVTEGDAARYIASITRFLLSQKGEALVREGRAVSTDVDASALALAASAESNSLPGKRGAAKTAGKPSSPRKGVKK